MCDRIHGIEIKTNNGNILILNVYLPYECRNNYDEYMNYLGKIHGIIQSADTPYVFVIGDMNADTYMGRNSTRTSIFGSELLSFCDENILVLSDVEKLSQSGDVFTHYSDAHDSVSWLDHCMTSTAANKLITDISVSDRFAVSDHLPLCITVNIGGIHLSDDHICPSIQKHTVMWAV